MKKLITSVALTGLALTLTACDNAEEVKDKVSEAAETVTEVVETAVAAPTTLGQVKKRGVLSCGVSTGLAGFSQKDEAGAWSAKERFTALQSGEIDMLSRNTTWTHTRDTSLGLNFAGTIYYDGAGFMVRRKRMYSSGHIYRASNCRLFP